MERYLVLVDLLVASAIVWVIVISRCRTTNCWFVSFNGFLSALRRFISPWAGLSYVVDGALRPTGASLSPPPCGWSISSFQNHELLGGYLPAATSRFTKVYKSMLFVSDNTSCITASSRIIQTSLIEDEQARIYVQNPMLRADAVALRTNSPPRPGFNLMLWIKVPTGMLSSGRAFRTDIRFWTWRRYVDLLDDLLERWCMLSHRQCSVQERCLQSGLDPYSVVLATSWTLLSLLRLKSANR